MIIQRWNNSRKICACVDEKSSLVLHSCRNRPIFVSIYTECAIASQKLHIQSLFFLLQSPTAEFIDTYLFIYTAAYVAERSVPLETGIRLVWRVYMCERDTKVTFFPFYFHHKSCFEALFFIHVFFFAKRQRLKATVR